MGPLEFCEELSWGYGTDSIVIYVEKRSNVYANSAINRLNGVIGTLMLCDPLQKPNFEYALNYLHKRTTEWEAG